LNREKKERKKKKQYNETTTTTKKEGKYLKLNNYFKKESNHFNF
jgi:hypothetical protein